MKIAFNWILQKQWTFQRYHNFWQENQLDKNYVSQTKLFYKIVNVKKLIFREIDSKRKHLVNDLSKQFSACKSFGKKKVFGKGLNYNQWFYHVIFFR